MRYIKVSILPVILLTIIALSSCEKDYECNCYYYRDSEWRIATGGTMTRQTEAQAEKKCEQLKVAVGTYYDSLRCGLE